MDSVTAAQEQRKSFETPLNQTVRLSQ